MKKLAVIFALISVLAVFLPASLFADENLLTELVDEQGNAIEWEQIEEYFEDLKSDFKSGGSAFDIFKQILSGEQTVGGGSFLKYLFETFFRRLAAVLPMLLTIVVVALLCGVLTKSKSTLFGKSTSEIVFFVCYAVIIVSVITSVWSYVNSTKETLTKIKTLTNIAMPVLLAFISAAGAKVGLAVYQPSVALLSNGIIEIACGLVMPLIIVTFVFSVVSNLSDNIKLDKIANFFRNFAVSVFGIAFTVFSAFLTVQGINANVFDSISIRAAKFATKNYIPILGGYLADGMDLILASSVLVKNAFGAVALLLLALTIAVPIVEMLVFSLLLQLTAGIIEPVTDERIVKFLSSVAKNITLLIVVLLGVAFMLFIVILLIISTANVF